MTKKDQLEQIENERDFAERGRGLACVHGEYKSRCRMCAEVRNEDALLAARAGMVPAAWKELGADPRLERALPMQGLPGPGVPNARRAAGRPAAQIWQSNRYREG